VKLLLLAIAFLFTGVNLIISKAVVEMGLAGYVPLYLVGFWGTGVAAGLVFRALSPHASTRTDFLMGTAMGAVGAVAMITFMFALEELPGVVVFPVRNCGNVLLTACLSYVIWRERLSRLQWFGIVCAVLAIYLLL